MGGAPFLPEGRRAGRVIFLDPSLGAARGHHGTVARNYGTLTLEGGREAVFAGHRGSAVEAPVFRHRLEDAFRVCRYTAPWMSDRRLARAAAWAARLRPARASLPAAAEGRALDEARFARLFEGLRTCEALGAIFARLAPSPADDVVALGVDPAVLSALHARRALFEGVNAPRLHLLYMYPERDFLSAATEDAYWRMARDITAFSVAHAELSMHAQALAPRLTSPVGVQMTPVRLAPLPPSLGGSFRVAVLGAGRADKGFLALPAIAAATHKVAPDVVLRVQMPVRGVGLDGAASALRASPNVCVLPAELSAEAYEAELAAAQVVLLAYDRERYAARGSGVLFDALVGGRPVICTAGTALAAEAAREASLTADGPDGFAAAICSACGREGELMAAAQAEARRRVATMRAGSLLTALGCAS